MVDLSLHEFKNNQRYFRIAANYSLVDVRTSI